MTGTLTERLVADHLVEGEMRPGEEIAIRIDQALLQDATGTLVMLELEAMGAPRAQCELAVQYVDHNLLQQDHRNPDDHRFLRSACRRFGLWYSPPGNGVSHPVHQERFGRPGATLLGSDSHSCAAGALGMLAIGAGGLEVAAALAGEPFYLEMPGVWGIHVVGELPEWVSAKDVILELLRRHGVQAGRGRVLEYSGPGLDSLSAMDRHVIANMGAELGATSSVFPSDARTREFLESQGRVEDWRELAAEDDASPDAEEELDLSTLEPLIAMPSSPGNVRPVSEVAGEPIAQAYVGSSANPGYRDFAVAAEILRERAVAKGVSFDVNPASRQVLLNLTQRGQLASLLQAGARLHQIGCNGCIGMGQAPATDQISLRTTPRNFPGRSGTREDRVCLVSPETAAASALQGRITDPRTLAQPAPQIGEPPRPTLAGAALEPPPADEEARRTPLERGPNIAPLPSFEPLPETLELPVLLRLGDDVSTDEILPAGARALPFRSNIPKIARFAFEPFDPQYAERAAELQRQHGGHVVVAGHNYGQGSSREHAALAPRYLGLRVVLARSFARIHWQNLVNYGVLPLVFERDGAEPPLAQGDVLRLTWGSDPPGRGEPFAIENATQRRALRVSHSLSPRQLRVVAAGGLIPWLRGAAGDAPESAERSEPAVH